MCIVPGVSYFSSVLGRFHTGMQGYLIAVDIEMYTGICLCDVPFVQCFNKQTKHYN